MAQEVSLLRRFLCFSLADLDAVAVDVEHILERVRVGRVKEADHINVILEVGVERIVVGRAAIASRPA
jgi:hypothetical protein